MRAALVLSLAALVGCRSLAGGGGSEREAPPSLGVAGMPLRHAAAFEALASAIEARDDATARAVLARIETRLDLEASAGVDARELAPPRELARSFGRVLDGRERVGALRAALVSRAPAGGGEVELALELESEWPSPLVLRPGPVTLVQRATLVTAMGARSRHVSTRSVKGLEELRLESGGSRRFPLGDETVPLTADVLAAEVEWSLIVRSGSVLEDARSYPAMHLRVAPTRRAYLAGHVPASSVEPQALVELLSRADLTTLSRERILPRIMERAVRVPLERRAEALEELRPFVARATPAELALAAPALSWLAGRDGPDSGTGWKEWLEGGGGEPPADLPALDVPVPGARW